MMSDEIGERKATNVYSLYFCIFFVLVLFGLVGYSFSNGSIARIVNGYDDCGNVCGQLNKDNKIDFCGSHDKSSDKFLLMNITQVGNLTDVHKKCVVKCEDYKGYKTVINRCFLFKGNDTEFDDGSESTSLLQAATEDLANSWVSIVIACVVALVFSYMLLVLFRYAIKYVIWVIYIGLIVVLFAISVTMVVFYFAAARSTDPQQREGAHIFLIVAGVMAVVTIIFGLVLFLFRKRIRLVVQLFKEASKALADVPLLIAEPMLTFISLALTAAAFIYFAIVIESAGHLEVENDEYGKFVRAEYQKNGAILAAHVFNFVAFLWFTSFILGCQHFVIASAVSDWFFARTKSKIESPISRGFSNLCRFHLGSVCLGSMLMTLVAIIRMIVNGVKNSLKNSDNPFAKCVAVCCEFIIETLEELLKYLVRNAYIVVAKDGTGLIDSGKKAFNLLFKNLIDVIALNQFGDFVLILGRLFVVLIAGFVGYELVSGNNAISSPFFPVLIIVVFAFLIVHCFMTVYEMTLDTIFLCFCEDCEINDGVSRPYYMSKDLMEVMQELKQEAGGEFNFGGRNNVEAGARPMINPNYQFNNN